jgi:hypothetical protein
VFFLFPNVFFFVFVARPEPDSSSKQKISGKLPKNSEKIAKNYRKISGK